MPSFSGSKYRVSTPRSAFSVEPLYRRHGALALLLVLGLTTAWFFLRVWRNVETLTGRTLPGINLAVELVDAAAELEIVRLGSNPPERFEQAVRQFEEGLRRYEGTVAVEQDIANLRAVQLAFADYVRNPEGETSARLRGDVRTLHQFRHERAMMFASDSKEGVTSALTVNVVGLLAFGILSFVISFYLGLVRTSADRSPDNF